jgi:hypothetical protein
MTDNTQRIPFDWARVPCPTCGAQPDQRCRALTTGGPTDTHRRRINRGDNYAVFSQLRVRL